ncbi:MAG: DUF547 domain-containing protein [Desulfovibrionaceae bacterium]
MSDNPRLSWRCALVVCACAFLFASAAAAPSRAADEEPVDGALYLILLKKNVWGKQVDYVGLKVYEGELDNYLLLMGATEPDLLSRRDRLAYYINMYNAWTLKLVLMHYPGIKSIKDIGWFLKGPWDQEVVRMTSGVLTLAQLESDILVKQFKDPRVLFAINCACKSCPQLVDEPYEGHSVDTQLDKVATAFVNDKDCNRLEGNVLYLSELFKLHEAEFPNGVLAFVIKYAKGDLLRRLVAGKDTIRIEYLPFDWSLNALDQ